MAKVRRCDMCGKHYPVKNLRAKKEKVYVWPETIIIKPTKSKSIHEKRTKHLCHACTMIIRKLFDSREVDTFDDESDQ